MDSSLLPQHRAPTAASSLVLPRLQASTKAPNMAQNERICQMIAEGRTVYHFGFGQSPFPVAGGAQRVLGEYAGENAYLPVAGTLPGRAALPLFLGIMPARCRCVRCFAVSDKRPILQSTEICLSMNYICKIRVSLVVYP